MKYKICFPDTQYSPCELEENSNLADELDASNSPVLFGCRTGLCGTCLIEVLNADGQLNLPDEIEEEALSIYAQNNQKARLACQIRLQCNIKIKTI
jgi:ferredoxin